MKPDLSSTTRSSQRRRWLGAVSAAAAAVWAWRARAVRTSFSTAKSAEPIRTAVSTAQAPSTERLVLKPSPDSVKRHG